MGSDGLYSATLAGQEAVQAQAGKEVERQTRLDEKDR